MSRTHQSAAALTEGGSIVLDGISVDSHACMLKKYLVCYLLIALDQLHLHYVQCCALESEYKVSWLMLLLSPFHIRSIKYLFHSPVSLQLICSFMATFTAFPLQTRSSCSWDSFRSMGNEISKTQTAYIYTADRDRWPYFDDTAASDWWKNESRPSSEIRCFQLWPRAASLIRARLSHPRGPGTYRCLLMFRDR